MLSYISSLLIITLLLLTPTAAFANGSFTGLETSFSSPEGIAALIPSFRDRQGHFSVPDPTKNAAQFLQAQQTLTILIDQAETQALMAVTPDQLQKRMAKKTMRLPANWKRAEIAVKTDGSMAQCADSGPNCSAYGSPSFLNRLEPVEGLESSFYRNIQPDNSVPALVYLQPTAVASVSRILLAAANTAGVWIPAAYALGPAGGDAFLIVNNCLDLAQTNNGLLAPNAMLVAALQWAS